MKIPSRNDAIVAYTNRSSNFKFAVWAVVKENDFVYIVLTRTD